MYYYLIISIPVVILAGLYFHKRKTQKVRKFTVENEKEEEQLKTVMETEKEKEEKPKPERKFHTPHHPTKQMICLLGDFQVRDQNGEDISTLFTPTLRTLLLLLIMHSEENPDGISGDKIVEILWSKKNKYAARNNRNVSLTKLRNILSRVGHIEIVNRGNYWKIIFGEEVLCDYSEINTYYHFIEEGISVDIDKFRINILLDLLYRGPLLYRLNQEWLNEYKARFSVKTIKVLTALLNNPKTTGHKFRLKIADTFLQHDYLNEQALQTQCVILYKEGEKPQMRLCYEKFCRNHANLLGIPYNKTLSTILKEGGARES